MNEISEATDDQAATAEEVVSMVDEVSSVSQQTAAEATNVSAASEEQTSSLSEATTNIEQLSQLAEELHDSVADFDVDAAAVPTRETTATPGGHTTEANGDRPSNGVASDEGPDVIDPKANLSTPENGHDDEHDGHDDDQYVEVD